MRPYPSLCEVLSDGQGSASYSFPGVLADMTKGVLAQQRKQFETDQTAGNKTAPGTPYLGDEQLLAPPYVLQLLCRLNRVNGEGLKASQAYTYYVCQNYLADLTALGDLLRKLGYASQIPIFPKTIDDLLIDRDRIPQWAEDVAPDTVTEETP